MSSKQQTLHWLQDVMEPYGHRGFCHLEEADVGYKTECQDCGYTVDLISTPEKGYCIEGAGEHPQCPKGESSSGISDKEFDDILEEIVGEMSPREILNVGGAYEALGEELNNQVLERWKARALVCDPYCLETDSGFICTLTRGHEGDHIAHGPNKEAVFSWGREAEIDSAPQM